MPDEDPPAGQELARTPLYEVHRRLGARLVPFAGFEMPVQYRSIVEEHRAVREHAGLFDVSHMGQLHLRGPAAIEAAERLLSCPVDSLRVGGVRYGLLCNERGGVVDDVTVYRTASDRVFLCVNAANIAKDREWIQSWLPSGVEVLDRSRETGLLALQGPAAADLVGALVDRDVSSLGRFSFTELGLGGRRVLLSNTGYTGSPGYEIYCEAGDAPSLFEVLLERGRGQGVVPAGLGARDTLRLEAALPLYGHELDDETSPLQAGLGRFVKRDRGGFLGARAIEERDAAGYPELLVGFRLEARGVARAGYPVVRGDEQVGRVTSGAPSPTLGCSIGLAYVVPGLAAPGTSLSVRVRGRDIPALVVDTPFVKRGRKAPMPAGGG